MSQVYIQSALILEALEQHRGGLKALLFKYTPDDNPRLRKCVYALTCQTLKYMGVLRKLVADTPIASISIKRYVMMKYVLVYELLFGSNKRVGGGGTLRKQILQHEQVLKMKLDSLLHAAGNGSSMSNESLLPPALQKSNEFSYGRYVRINTLKTDMNSVLQVFKADGYEVVLGDASVPKDIRILHVDPHVDNLLCFHSSVELHASPLVRSGSVILQDKSSCMPAQVLDPQPGWHVIDACAAPGNKTSHLAALLSKCGCVDAFERNKRRFAVLKKRIDEAGAESFVKCYNANFLSTSHKKFAAVDAILVDPSCSGSGLLWRKLDHLVHSVYREEKEERNSLAALQKMQIELVSHALSFPNVKRVVYSTCSTHQAENEDVVESLLKLHPSFRLERALPSWHRRGLSTFHDGDLCIRCDPQLDGTSGFFVALFVRREGCMPLTDCNVDAINHGHTPSSLTIPYVSSKLSANANVTMKSRKRRKRRRLQ